jgi:hypothetical protein
MNILTEKSTVFCVFGKRLFSVIRTARRGSPVQQEQEAAGLEHKGATPLAEPIGFVVNSLFLHDCFRELTRTEDEGLHAVSGSVVGRLRTLDRMVPLRLSRQSVAGASADDRSLADQLIKLNEFGLLVLAYFHSHPGQGADATTPSGTDRRTQEAMEEAGAEIVGAIFSRDGYVRFYANRFQPKVKVVGKRIEEVMPNVFHLELED